jgi:hypothetical protein
LVIRYTCHVWSSNFCTFPYKIATSRNPLSRLGVSCGVGDVKEVDDGVVVEEEASSLTSLLVDDDDAVVVASPTPPPLPRVLAIEAEGVSKVDDVVAARVVMSLVRDDATAPLFSSVICVSADVTSS